MSQTKKKQSAAARLKRHWWKAALVLILVVFVKPLLSSKRADAASSEKIEAAVTAEVTLEPFILEVIESGNIESSSNVEIRCEADVGSAGITILEIIPEGSYVEEGDFLIRLDDAALQDKLIGRQIDVNGSRAALAQARADKETARLELAEYESGTFVEQEEQMESEIFVSQENLRRAQEYLVYSQRLSEKGYVSSVQLEADRFAVDKALKELEVARTKLSVLRTYTKEKMITQLSAKIETTIAKHSAAERTFNIDEAQLEETERQIELCTILAPASGQVVYSNKESSTGEPLIEEGKTVVERQEIIRLPDPKRMHVVAAVNESRIDLIETEMTVTIALDALPDIILKGEVVDVTEYPLPRKNSYVAHIKNYGVTVKIIDPPASLRQGMTAETAILVDQRDEALQVPVQAIVERENQYYCIVRDEENKLQPMQVEIGASNNTSVVIENGLVPGQELVLSPEEYIDKLRLPTEVVDTRKAVKDQQQLLAAERARTLRADS
ncbi:MAG: HlyD family secretion protein [Verrucomicrobiales bacterium]|jgi:HlyD family secretion protein